MIKSNLPVILLKGLVLLPHQEARIELNNNISKKVVDISKEYHDDEVLIITPINTLEEEPDISDLPKVGVVGKIRSNIVLPNGNTRIVIAGIKRVKVYSYVNYSNDKDVLESIVASVNELVVDEVEETAILRKLIQELEKYININPYISNSIISQISGITDLDKLTDLIANFLPLNFEKKFNLMLNTNYISRAKTLITEINIEKAVLELENKIEIELKKGLDDTQKEFILKEKIKLMQKELGEKDTKDTDISNILDKISKTKLPKSVEEKLNNEIEKYKMTPEISPEIAVIKNYIDCLLNIPWGKFTKDENNLNKIEKKLNESHFGLDEVKTRIIEYIAVKSSNSNQIKSPIICLVGPPGVGKTTFAEQVAISLNRKFAKISLGGMSDSAELVGHRRTYIGSNPGKIISTLIKIKSQNPVFLLDEVDKLNKDFRGDPASTLLDILDVNQNKKFVDNYIDEEVDLSNVFFILTANDLNAIPKVLQDRLEIIELSGYTEQEKLSIANKYLITKSCLENGLNKNTISFDEKAITKIITEYTRESGVRELSRLIDKIIRKIITKHKKNNQKITSIRLSDNDIEQYLSVPLFDSKFKKHKTVPGYITGVAYTALGGTTLEVEVTSFPGKGNIITTGSLGETLKESIEVALSYIKSNIKTFGLNMSDFNNKDFHVNFRETAIPKDGPSAGSLIVTAIISYLKGISVFSNVSMTGEITLKGDILPIGGLKEKTLAALKYGINKLYIPSKNKKDLVKIDEFIKKKINFVLVNNYDEIYKDLFTKK